MALISRYFLKYNAAIRALIKGEGDCGFYISNFSLFLISLVSSEWRIKKEEEKNNKKYERISVII